jgi:hypothetical protein
MQEEVRARSGYGLPRGGSPGGRAAADAEESQPLHLGVKRDTVRGEDPLLHQGDQLIDVAGGGATGVDDEIGVNRSAGLP